MTNGALILDAIRAFVRCFVVLDDFKADAVALWMAHTWIFNVFPCTPYLAVTSPEKRSGTTRLLEVIELLVRKPLPTANISDAALFRITDQTQPTLLVDEVDAIFGRRGREREELRGLLCAGYRHGAVAHRMGGANNTTLQTFDVYSPRAFAGIGDCLPDTISDRSIAIRLKRRTRDERVERFRLRDVEASATTLRDRLAGWLEPNLEHIATLRPTLPEELDDRAQDVWEPLLALADLTGSAVWSERGRRAALALSTGEERDDDSATASLLRDIHAIFTEGAGERLRTADLLKRLWAIEDSPWGEWNGKPLTAHGLSKLLKPLRIKTMAVYVGSGETARGYKAEQFADACSRVLGVRSVSGVRSESASEAAPNASNAPNAHHENGRLRLGDPGYAMQADQDYAHGLITPKELAELIRLDALASRSRRSRPEDDLRLEAEDAMRARGESAS